MELNSASTLHSIQLNSIIFPVHFLSVQHLVLFFNSLIYLVLMNLRSRLCWLLVILMRIVLMNESDHSKCREVLVCARSGAESLLVHRLSNFPAEHEGFLGLVASQHLLAGRGQVGVVGAGAQHLRHLVLLLRAS
jgi:hypothetical protein